MPTRQYRVQFTCIDGPLGRQPVPFDLTATFEVDTDADPRPYAPAAVRDTLRERGLNPAIVTYEIDIRSVVAVT